MQQEFKRQIAFKYRIGQVLGGKNIMEGERIKSVEIQEKNVIRINIIGNVVEKYIQEGERKFGTLTLDDGSGQIKIKSFGEDVDKLTQYTEGETVLVIGLLRVWNNEIYIAPEIIKKKEPTYLLIRKLEVEKDLPTQTNKEQVAQLKDKILAYVKEAEKNQGIDIEKLIQDIKEHPSLINQEIRKLLEEGMIYEPRPGRLRYLG
jgi:RPA family protein